MAFLKCSSLAAVAFVVGIVVAISYWLVSGERSAGVEKGKGQSQISTQRELSAADTVEKVQKGLVDSYVCRGRKPDPF